MVDNSDGKNRIGSWMQSHGGKTDAKQKWKG